MRCKGCGEEYSEEMFPVCPFCCRPNEDNAPDESIAVEKEVNVDDSEQEVDVGQEHFENSKLHENIINMEIQEQSPQEESAINIAEISISELFFLSTRSRNALLHNNIQTIGDLRKYTETHNIMVMPHVGASSAKEILAIEDNIPKFLEQIKSRKNRKIQFNSNYSDTFLLNDISTLSVRSKNALAFIGLRTVADLKEYLSKNDVRKIKNVGAGSAKEILTVLKSNDSEEFKNTEVEEVENKLAFQIEERAMFTDIHQELKHADLSILQCFGFADSQIKILKDQGINVVGDLMGISSSKIFEIEKNNFLQYEQIESLLAQSVLTLMREIVCQKGKKEKFDIWVSRASGYTLQEVGEMYHITRERVRQVVSNIYRNLNVKIFMQAIIHPFIEQKGFARVQELLDVSDDDEFDNILIHWCKNSEIYYYIDYADVFVKDPGEMANEQILLKFAEDFIGDGIDVSEHMEEIESYIREQKINYLDTHAFVELLLKSGYRLYKNVLVYGRKSYGYLCARAIGKYFPNGIKLYDHESLNRLRQLVLNEYGDIGLADSDRALSTRISEFTVLCGRGTVTVEENIHVDMELLENIREYIDNEPVRELNYSQVYAKFEGMLKMMSNIDNYNFLHGVLKLYYPNNYDYSQRDHLTKLGSGLKSGRLSSRINELILNLGRPVHKKEIKQAFGCSDIVITNAAIADDKLLQWDYNYYSSLDLFTTTEAVVDTLADCIREIMEKVNGYCSDTLLFEKAKQVVPDFLMDNNLENHNNLYFFVAKILKDKFNFRRPHIVNKDYQGDVSVKGIALYLLGNPDELNYNEYLNLVKKLKWSNGTTTCMLLEMEIDYIRISNNLYKKADLFYLNDDELAKIKMALQSRLQEEYLSLMNFDDWDDFPEIDYQWNEFLLHDIIVHFIPELKIIETRAKDRRYERGIVVKTDSLLNTYEDVVVYFMKSHGLCESGENKLLSMLVSNNLTYKMLPQDLYTGNKLQYKDEKFSIVN